jgi:hypothetical protein
VIGPEQNNGQKNDQNGTAWGQYLILRLQQGKEQRVLVRTIAVEQHVANEKPFSMAEMTHEIEK